MTDSHDCSHSAVKTTLELSFSYNTSCFGFDGQIIIIIIIIINFYLLDY